MDTSTSQSVATYKHDDFPDASAHIRLLQVLNDNYSENFKVQCEITTWPLDNAPAYHAISYTWGDPESNTTILINGKAFRVRANCEFVLKQAYWFEKTYYYWVDAICINQGNLAEKSMQVSMMGSIFKQAAHVIACVGDHADDSAFLLEKLKQGAFTKKPYRRYFGGMRLSLGFQLGQPFSTTVRFLHAVFRFIERPYFTRLWILQEMRNAQEATFLCGSDAIPKRIIEDMSRGIFSHSVSMIPSGKLSSVITKFARRLLVLRRLWTVQEYWWKSSNASKEGQGLANIAERAWHLVTSGDNVLMLIEAASVLQCQERKDKVFGLISLIDWGDCVPLLTDYTQTDFEVAVSFTGALLNAGKYSGGNFDHWEVPTLCSNVVGMLELDINSNGVHSSLESRGVEPGTILAGEETAVEFACSSHKTSTGWRVSSEHLAKSDLGFSTWSPPGSDKTKVYLPFWAKGGDWVVAESSYPTDRFLVVREAAEGFGGPLVGHAVSERPNTKSVAQEVACAKFTIHWDPEDLVVYSVVRRDRWRLEKYSTEWAKSLNAAVCKNYTPASSYALRHDGNSCQL